MKTMKPIKMACASAFAAMLASAGVVYAQAQASESTSQPSSTSSSTPMSSGTNSSGTSAPAGESSAGASSSSAAGTSTAAGTLNSTDKKMMMQLAQANIAEIETAKLAQTQTKNPDVLAFAEKMIDDHMQAAEELAKLAQEKNVTLPGEPDAKHQALAKKMAKLEGDKFDKQYMAHAGMEDHQATIALLKRINTRAADPDLKALAGKMLPTVEEHLNTAKEKKQ